MDKVNLEAAGDCEQSGIHSYSNLEDGFTLLRNSSLSAYICLLFFYKTVTILN